MPQHSGTNASSYNGVHRRPVPSTQSHPAAAMQFSPSYLQYYNAEPTSTFSHLDRVQQQPGLLSGRSTHHNYSHERSSASSTSALPDINGSISCSSHNWGGQATPDDCHPIPSNTRLNSAPSGGMYGSFSQSYSLNPAARRNTLDSGTQASQEYHYAPMQGHHSPSRAQLEVSRASISWRYESSQSPAPSENSQYRLSPGFSMQSASSPDSLSDPTDESPSRRRRRTKLTDGGSAASISSEASSTCNSPQLGTISSSSSPRPGSRDISAKPGPSRKVRGKHSRSKQTTALGEGPSFNVFMVNPSPAMQEPSGATYMSTVNFDADASADAFEHGPTDLPPRPYIGGPDATSPWKPRKNLGTIPGSAMEYLPVVEARIKRLEGSLNAYVEYRGQRAVKNAVLPGLNSAGSGDEMDCDTSLDGQ